jgi:hypothetical protein
VPATLQPELIEDAIPLTRGEKELKAQLEGIVERGLEEFLKVGTALAELRAKRLYRTEFGTFELYVQNRFGLHRSRVDALIRSSSVARSLLDHGIELSPTTNEATVRPLCGLPDDDNLRAATWEFVQTIAPECGPSQPIVSRVCRVIRNCIDGVQEGEETSGERAGFHVGARKARAIESPARELPFTGAIRRLANWSGFSVGLVVASASKLPSAENLYSACGTMRERCRLVQERLLADYPELTRHA